VCVRVCVRVCVCGGRDMCIYIIEREIRIHKYILKNQ
jgi:hypothetical protein